jgi:O-6-methylguanine DNA methyltransferase
MTKNIEEIIGSKNLSAPAFYKQVFTIVSKIPKGKVSTYGDVAKAAGKPGAARVVGTAMANNKDTDHVPCHRVVKSDGKVGSYGGGPEGSREKKRRLMDERIEFYKSSLKIKNFEKVRIRDF